MWRASSTSARVDSVLDSYKGNAYPFRVTTDVKWGDMDALAHLNNVQYFVLFEHVRCAFFDSVGLSLDGNMKRGPILKSTSCEYKAPTAFPDTLTVGLRSVVTSDTEYEHHYAIVSHASAEVIATGDGKLGTTTRRESAPICPQNSKTRLRTSDTYDVIVVIPLLQVQFFFI